MDATDRIHFHRPGGSSSARLLIENSFSVTQESKYNTGGSYSGGGRYVRGVYTLLKLSFKYENAMTSIANRMEFVMSEVTNVWVVLVVALMDRTSVILSRKRMKNVA